MNSSPPLALVGPSEGAQRARESLERAAGSDVNVLIETEPGCRAGDVAHAVHRASRPRHPFVGVSCAGGPLVIAGATLEPADLFGSTAVAPGELEVIGHDAALLSAAGGTVYIEGLDDLSASAQRRLSRVLRDGEVCVGGDRRRLTCRVVASMWLPPGDEREPGVRDDLLRRFGQLTLTIPPLRQRPADIGAMIERLAASHSPPPRHFTQAALTVLAALPWPRNLDELAATVAALVDPGGTVIRQEDVLAHLPIEGAFPRVDTTLSLRDARRRFERDYIAAVLERHHWRMSEAAQALGIERANLYRKARQLGIQKSPRAEAS